MKATSPKPASRRSSAAPDRVAEVLRLLERRGTKATRDGYARYGIVAPKSYGVGMAAIQQIAKRVGRDHALALELWKTGWYEARLLTAFVDEADRVTAAQMDAWARDFDNWAIVDTLCFKLWDRTPHAWRKIEQWSTRRGEFQKRASFALLACVALHDKAAPDAPFVKSLSLLEREATDDRNFVKKGVIWALRGIGGRNAVLRAAVMDLAQELAASDDATARATGKTVIRELSSKAAKKRLAR